MKNRLFLICLILISFKSINLQGQDGRKYFIKNYFDNEIGSSVVNWEAIQGETGEIYVANTEGLLKYNGKNWTNYLDEKIFSIAADNHGTIYIGTQGDFGYLMSNHKGIPIFKSLKKMLDPHLDLKSTVWDILPLNDGVYFSSKQGIFRWNGENMKIWESLPEKEYSVRISNFKGRVITNKENTGIVVLTENGDSLLFNHPKLQNENLYFIDDSAEKLTFGVKNKGLLQSTDSYDLTDINEHTNNFFNNYKLFTELVKYRNQFLAGSQVGGMVILDSAYNIVSIINTKSGIQENAVRDITLDDQGNLWCSLLLGVSRIDISSPWSRWKSEDGLDGALWSRKIRKLQDKITVGTTKGLFYLDEERFEKIDSVKSKIWDIESVKSSKYTSLIISSEQGLVFLSTDYKVQSILPIMATNLIGHNTIPGIAVVSGIDGIYIVDLNNDYTSTLIHTFSNKDQIVLSSVEDNHSNIWIGARDLGVYKISDLTADAPKIEFFDSRNGISGFSQIAMTMLNNTLMVGTSDGLFIYNTKTNSFESSGIVKESVEALAAINDSSMYITYYDQNGGHIIEKLFLKNNKVLNSITVPYKRIEDSEIISIMPDGNVTWFATTDGLFKFDETAVKDYDIPFNTLISRVTSLDTLLFAGTYSEFIDSTKSIIVTDQPKSYQPTLKFDNNSIRFEYAATFYELPEKNQFSYYLEGNDKYWSSWSTENIKEYNNLSPGHYTFHVKSKNLYDKEGRVARYEFTILAPWYMTAWAYALFTVAAGLFIWFVALAYTYRVRLQRRKLKLLVADRTFEVLSQKKEIEKQNSVLKEQYEEIQQQRDAIDEKNQELEMSQEEILSINEKLQELNTSLEKKVDERTSEIKTTVKKLQSSIAELDTFIYRASHDLKGPISRINGLTSLAKLETTNLNDVKYYNLIELVAKDMNKLLAKLTQVHEVINCQPELEWVDLPVLITDIRNSIKFLDPDEKTKYSFVLESTLQVKADQYLLAVILTNLMENSLIFKNSSKSISEVKISSNQDDSQFFITIEDNGMGIPVEHIDKVFNMFYRGSDQSKGSGLGLYLAQMAAEKLGGDLKVESEFGSFTKFTLRLPKKVS